MEIQMMVNGREKHMENAGKRKYEAKKGAVGSFSLTFEL